MEGREVGNRGGGTMVKKTGGEEKDGLGADLMSGLAASNRTFPYPDR